LDAVREPSYTYEIGAPTRVTDPSGRFGWSDVLGRCSARTPPVASHGDTCQWRGDLRQRHPNHHRGQFRHHGRGAATAV